MKLTLPYHITRKGVGTMDLTITGKNLEINDTIRKYVEKKIGRLDRYLPNIIDGRVELTVVEGAPRPRTGRSPRSRYAPRT